MDLLDDLYFYHAKRHQQTSQEYRNICYLEQKLEKTLSQLQPELTEKLIDAIDQRVDMDCKAFFLYGLRFALELQRL